MRVLRGYNDRWRLRCCGRSYCFVGTDPQSETTIADELVNLLCKGNGRFSEDWIVGNGLRRREEVVIRRDRILSSNQCIILRIHHGRIRAQIRGNGNVVKLIVIEVDLNIISSLRERTVRGTIDRLRNDSDDLGS